MEEEMSLNPEPVLRLAREKLRRYEFNELDGSREDMDILHRAWLNSLQLNERMDWMNSSEDDIEVITTTTESSVTPAPNAMSHDSLAFFLVYCTVFILTILYIGVKLSKNWRKRRHIEQALADNDDDEPAINPTRCNHAVCRQVHETTNHLVPYSGLGAIWIPELMNIENGRGIAGPMHNTSRCNNSCDNCRQLSQPPPSYTKLFLDDSPPSYTDAVEVYVEELNTAYLFETSLQLHEEPDSPPTYDLLVRIPDPSDPLLQDESKPESRAELESNPESGAESESKPESGAELESKPESGAESEINPEEQSKTEPEVEIESDSEVEPEPEVTDSDSENEPVVLSVTESGTKSETGAQNPKNS